MTGWAAARPPATIPPRPVATRTGRAVSSRHR